MTSLLVGFIGVCAFSSLGMAFNQLIDIRNKDIKLGGKSKGKGRNEDEIKSLIEELGE